MGFPCYIERETLLGLGRKHSSMSTMKNKAGSYQVSHCESSPLISTALLKSSIKMLGELNKIDTIVGRIVPDKILDHFKGVWVERVGVVSRDILEY